MKFFSVFVLCFYVRSVYSLYTGSSVPSNPVVSSNVYPISNSQNLNQPIRPQLQASRLPAAVQNAYPTQHEYTMGPGLPVPYQIAQTASGSKRNVLINPKPSSGRIPNQVSALHHLKFSPYLKQLYKTSFPTKRYTVVHPNGTIEHTNEIHVVKVRYPNYHMVKSTDILAQPYLHRRASENLLPSHLNKSVTTSSQNYKWSSINSNGSNNIQSWNNRFGSPAVSNVNPVNQVYPKQRSQETIVKSPDVASNLNVVSFNSAGSKATESDIKQNIQDVTKVTNEIIEKTGNSDPSITQNLQSNVVAANPLPIYPIASVSDAALEKKAQPSEFPAANNKVPIYPTVIKGVGDAVAVLNSNSTDLNNEVDNQILEIKRTESIKPTVEVQIPIRTSQHEALEVILPEILPQNTTQEMQIPTTIEGPVRSKIKPEVNTIEEPIAPHNANLSALSNDMPTSPKLVNVLEPNVVLDVSQSQDFENMKSIDTSNIPINTTNTTEAVEELQKSSYVKSNSTAHLQNYTVPSVSNQSSTIFGNSAPLTWFELSEKNVWDAIRNNFANVYFFFMPPKPKKVKEIRTTIYPNGTTVEQIIETDVDQVQDGVTKLINNSSIDRN